MIPIPKYAKNVKINVVEDVKTNSIKEIHYQYEVDDEKMNQIFTIETGNIPPIARMVINQAQLASKIFKELIEKQKINKSLNK